MLQLDFLTVLDFFFPGWLCYFERLFIPVWRKIQRSKILPVTSWQLTNGQPMPLLTQHVLIIFFPIQVKRPQRRSHEVAAQPHALKLALLTF